MSTIRFWRGVALSFTGAAMCTVAAHAQEAFKLGIVSFLSGQAAESFGIPAVNGAKVVIDAFNKGAAPAPYNKPGFGGVKIEAVYVDESCATSTTARRSTPWSATSARATASPSLRSPRR
jgi:hypothetical protein